MNFKQVYKLINYINKLIFKIKIIIGNYKYEKREKNLLIKNNFSLKKEEGEDEYIDFYKSIFGFKSPWAYRLYSKYIGPNISILSQEGAFIISDFLNEKKYIPLYQDKNLFDKFLPGMLPQTIIRKIDNHFYNDKYKKIDLNNSKLDEILKESNFETIVVKETIETDSGRGVKIFNKNSNNIFIDKELNILDFNYLNNLSNDIIIQEGVKQHKVLSNLCKSSINTIRIATYKSIKDDEIKILSSVIRIGHEGSPVDNLHQGGCMVRINDDGKLNKYAVNQYGQKFLKHNNIDFEKQDIYIPNWNQIISFAKKINELLPHLRLLQLDISLNENGNPILIEFNCTGFSMWISQFTGTPALGEYTSEILNYYKNNKK
ncbi:MAG: hypothetical protein J1F12_00910 [Muribaculaceae bacterium]|nr:hypothetical protein [Muribaculaceae bacterium]